MTTHSGVFKPYTADDLVRARIETPEYKFRSERTDTITCMAGGAEMLRVAADGFWVRGQKVNQDEHEAQAVYEAFKAWMTWAQLNRDYK